MRGQKSSSIHRSFVPLTRDMKPVMRFSWKAILFAPLAVPLFTGSVFTASTRGEPVFTFLFFFGLAAVFSYGATVCVLLPCLFLLSRFKTLTAWVTGFVGIMLGLAIYFPMAWVSHRASGDNSGPPTDTFFEYLWRKGLAEGWMLPAAGLVTALLYWFLSAPRKPKAEPAIVSAEIA